MNLLARPVYNFWCRYFIAALLSLLTWQCSDKRGVIITRHVMIDQATKLEVVEWGGSGIPVVFLSGLGHTAHVFDELAPKLTNEFRVLGITRRGFGASSQPDSGYDISTLVEDIRILLDSLGIAQAVFIGHSLGGDEMTLLTRNYPETVKALVYIEAAYNRVTARELMAEYAAPSSDLPPPTADDIISPEAFRAYYAKVNGVVMPLSEIIAINRWAPDGRRTGNVTPSWIYDRISKSIQDPDYSQIDIPALAIYAINYPVTELFIDYHERDSSAQKAMRAYHEAAIRTDSMSREYFKANMAKGRIVEIDGAGHSLYISHEKETLDAIRTFLAEIPR